MGNGRNHSLDVPRDDYHGRYPHVLLPSSCTVRVRGHEVSHERCSVWSSHPKYASLGCARNGHHRHVAHVQSVSHWFVQTAASIQLGHRGASPCPHSLAQLYRVSSPM